MPWITRAWTYEPFAIGEKVQLRLPVDTRTYDKTFFSAFLEDLSDAFQQTKRELLVLSDGRVRDDDIAVAFDLQVQLEIVPGMQKPAAMASMLRHINRKVFHVTKVYVIPAPELVELVDVYREVHTFRGTAEVETHFDVPAASMDRTKLIRWKWFLDLTARKAFGHTETQQHPWIVAAMFGEPGLDRDCYAKATAATAFLSALAHSGDYVTTGSLVMALADPRHDRALRAKYIGYLLRCGTLTKLSFRDQFLTRDDVANILAIYGMPTRDACVRALHLASWHNRTGSVLDDKTASKYLSNANEVLGVMHDSGRGETVDVLLAGFGQCSVARSLVQELRPAATEANATEERGRPLKQLDLLFLNEEPTAQSMVRLATVVGRPLEELRMELEQGEFQLMHVFMLLEACRSLRKLSIKQIALTSRDDKIPFTAPSPREHALESLSVEFSLNSDDPRGLVGFCTMLGTYSSTLKELELQEPSRAEVTAMNKLLGQHLPSLTKLRVKGIMSRYLQPLWDHTRPSLLKVQELLLEGVLWDKPDWTAFLTALADASHPLAQSVRTLQLQLNGFEKMAELQTMLQKNVFLAHVAIDLPHGLRTSHKLIEVSQATNGKSVYGLKEKLTPRHQAAFLSGVAATRIPMETQNVQSVLDFAATSETRYVRVSLVSTRQDG